MHHQMEQSGDDPMTDKPFTAVADNPAQINQKAWEKSVKLWLSPEARDALERLEAGTHVLVPVEPTIDACIAVLGVDKGYPSESYRDLIQAAQEGK